MGLFKKKKENTVETKLHQDPEQIKQKDRKKQHKNLADIIVDHNRGIMRFILIVIIINAFLSLTVGINYDLTVYLPDFATSKIAIDKMTDTFGYPGTGRIMLKDVTLYEAKEYKDRIAAVDGVDQLIWCDLTNSIYTSSEFIDYGAIEDYYKDNCAVMDVTFIEGDYSDLTHAAIDEINAIIGERGYLVGMSPTSKFNVENVEGEMKTILTVAVAMIFIILMLTTTSYLEPVLFLLVIGAAIVINKGTNVVLGEISHITNNILAVIQLATSMDYAIFLLSAYERERKGGLDKESALKAGLNTTIRTVLSSSLTTFFGFVVLVFMKFKIGFDLGVVMSKSIICSLLMVIFFMPALLLMMSDMIDKTRHRALLPELKVFSRVVCKVSPFILIVMLLLAVPMYFTQNMNSFMYGVEATGAGERTEIYHQAKEIDAKFGRSNMLVAIFPDEGSVKEKQLIDELDEKTYIKKVMGMSSYLPDGMYEGILPNSLTEMFHKNGYTRLLIYMKTKSESPAAYMYSDEVEAIIDRYYGAENVYLAGTTPTTMDMQEILSTDYAMVNMLAIISIFLVVAIAFKSPVVPIGAMIPIMCAIYLNMSFPYLAGNELIFIAYAVVSCVQLGSTIDYAILTIENYSHIRVHEPDKNKAAIEMIKISFPSMLTSGGILIACGYIVYFVSTSPAICEVGHLIGRGAIFSVFFVTTLMPQILKLMDRFIVTTSEERRQARIQKLRELRTHEKTNDEQNN
ncbi:MAG: MMPL family transporter [Eubacteriales bacterium]|nr:MMPL family transporter [Eubacteriales bacterium]